MPVDTESESEEDSAKALLPLGLSLDIAIWRPSSLFALYTKLEATLLHSWTRT